MNEPKNNTFDLAWKTIRNNTAFQLPEDIDEQVQEDLWDMRKQWFIYGWNNKSAFKGSELAIVGGKDKKLYTGK